HTYSPRSTTHPTHLTAITPQPHHEDTRLTSREHLRKVGNMTALVKKLVADDAGQDLAEYGIALAVIGTVAAAAAIVIAKDVGTLWSKAQNVIDSAAS